MPKGIVEMSTINGQPWIDKKGKTNQNFIIKFKGANDNGDEPERYIFVSDTSENTTFKVGDEVDYNIKTQADGSQWKIRATVNGKTHLWPAIEQPKQNKGVFGGGGGNKTYVKTPEQYKNELLGYIGGYAKDVIAHRVNLGKDAEDIIIVYEKLVDGMFKALSKHIQ